MLTILRDPHVTARLRDERFAAAWQRLYDRCPWATVIQSWPFVSIWSEIYRHQYELVLICDLPGDGSLAGVLALAVERATGHVGVAGGIYAEYQVWLAAPSDSDPFIVGALGAARRLFPRQRLRLLFVPPRTPLGWTSTAEWVRRSDVHPVKRPLMDVSDTTRLHESLKKKHNRSHMNHLQRHGALRLAVLAEPDELAQVYDEIDAFAALRLSGTHGEVVVIDPLKKLFFVRLAEAGLVHATLLRAGDAIVSAQVHLRNRDESLRGMSAFSPRFAKHSPSNIHTLMLGLELGRQGISVVDLTPGGEYKEQFATHEDTAHVLTVFRSRADWWGYKMRRVAVNVCRWILDVTSVPSAQCPAGRGRSSNAPRGGAPGCRIAPVAIDPAATGGA